MKDLKSVDSKGKRLSKGYGFVSFVRHEDALETLRRINNNPEVFSINKVCYTFLYSIKRMSLNNLFFSCLNIEDRNSK